jgi:hypothetical protein
MFIIRIGMCDWLQLNLFWIFQACLSCNSERTVSEQFGVTAYYSISSSIFLNVTPYSQVEVHQWYGRMYCLHLQGCSACFWLVTCLAYSPTWKMGAVCSSERPVNFYQTTRYHLPDGNTLQSPCENLKPRPIKYLFLYIKVLQHICSRQELWSQQR